MIHVEYGLHGESNKLACTCQGSPHFNLEITTIVIWEEFEKYTAVCTCRDDRLDTSTVKNLIGRSTSRAEVKRAISFKQRGEGTISPPPVLQKAYEFRQGEGIINPNENVTTADVAPTDEEAPHLPDMPPPEIQVQSATPSDLHKKSFSPPVSPKQKRVEHLKDEDKKKKRTPSFNLRRRTRSFKEKYKIPENLPPPDFEGHVERKVECQSGGKRATIRSWKNYYMVLYGQVLVFYKDKEGMCSQRLTVGFGSGSWLQ